MLEMLKSPEALTFGLMLAAVLLPALFGYLKSKVVKTKTMADDEFLAAIESIVNAKLDRLNAKKTKAAK